MTKAITLLLSIGLAGSLFSSDLGSPIAIALKKANGKVISATIRPAHSRNDDRYGWFHLERSTSLGVCNSWATINYAYGTWQDFELTDNQPHLELSIYRVAFFRDQ